LCLDLICVGKSQEFTEDDLISATNNYEANRKLGVGGFGSVYKGYINCSNVAIKLLTEVNDELMIYVHINFMPEMQSKSHLKIGTLLLAKGGKHSCENYPPRLNKV